jgi:hypothetical protein
MTHPQNQIPSEKEHGGDESYHPHVLFAKFPIPYKGSGRGGENLHPCKARE